MNCEVNSELLEKYIFGDLEEKKSKEISDHIEHCEKCRIEYKEQKECIDKIKAVYAAIEAEGNIVETKKFLTRKPEIRRRSGFKILLVASIFLLILSISLSPIMAKVIENIPNLIKYFSSNDKGIINSLENGFGQQIEIGDSKKGVNFKVHNIISDQNRTIVLFSIKLDDDVQFDQGQISRIFIKNQFGEEIPIHTTSYSYSKEENIFTGNIIAEELSVSDETLTIGFKEVKLTKNEEMKLDIDLEKDLGNQEMDLGIKGIKSFMIQSIKNLGEIIEIKYEVRFENSNSEIIDPAIKILSKSGDDIQMGVMQSLLKNGTGFSETARFNVKDISLSDLLTVVEYNTLDQMISSSWEVSFDVDVEKAKNYTLEKLIQKKETINGVEVYIDKIVATPSQTKLYIQVDNTENSGVFYTNSFNLMILDKVYNSTGVSTSSADDGSYWEHIYEFEPVNGNVDNVKLILENEMNTKYTDARLELNDISTNNKKTAMTLESYDLDITYRREGEDLIITIYTEDIYFENIKVELISDDGKRSPNNIITLIHGQGGSQGGRNEIRFSDYSEAKAEIQFSSYTIIENDQREIQLVP